MDDSLNVSVLALAKQVETDAIANWSEVKKKDFVSVFRQRAAAAKYIFFVTARNIIATGERRKILSEKQARVWRDEHIWNQRSLEDHKPECMQRGNWCNCSPTVGGRSLTELDELAAQRAENIISELPSVKKALSIIQPDVAKKMDRREVLLKEGQELIEELESLSEPIYLRNLPRETTIGEILDKADQIEEQRDAIIAKQAKIGREGRQLESEINHALFKGIPELSDALLKVAHSHHERGIAFDQATRRIEERVMFGDSQEAMALLQRFEADEIQVSDTTKAEFSAALDRLKLLGPKKVKAKKGEDDGKENT